MRCACDAVALQTSHVSTGLILIVGAACHRFHKVFACSYSYVFTLTIPNSVRAGLTDHVSAFSDHQCLHAKADRALLMSIVRMRAVTVQVLTYWAFPAATVMFGNAFAVYPPSAYRTTAIILMIGHQMVAFLLFIMPVCFLLMSPTCCSLSPTVTGLPAQVAFNWAESGSCMNCWSRAGVLHVGEGPCSTCGRRPSKSRTSRTSCDCRCGCQFLAASGYWPWPSHTTM